MMITVGFFWQRGLKSFFSKALFFSRKDRNDPQKTMAVPSSLPEKQVSPRIVASTSSLCFARVRDVKVIGVPARGLIMIRPYVFAPPTTLPQRQHGLYGVSKSFSAFCDSSDQKREEWLLEWAEKRLAERHNLVRRQKKTDDDDETVVYSLEGDVEEEDLPEDSDFEDVSLHEDDDADTETVTSEASTPFPDDDDEEEEGQGDWKRPEASLKALAMYANHSRAFAFGSNDSHASNDWLASCYNDNNQHTSPLSSSSSSCLRCGSSCGRLQTLCCTNN